MKSSSAPYIEASLRYHLLSTVIVVAWGIFIVGTITVHELAHRLTWNPSRILTGAAIPWAFRPGPGLPSILRTVFTQAHGPITAMHLARLSLGALEVSWASPKTWMEVFLLADRRWSGPVGLAQTGWVMATRRRLRVSVGFTLFAVISVATLATPVVMTRAYTTVSGHVNHTINTNASVFDLSAAPAGDDL